MSACVCMRCTCYRGRGQASTPGCWGCGSPPGRHSPLYSTSGTHHSTSAWSTSRQSAPGSSHPSSRVTQIHKSGNRETQRRMQTAAKREIIRVSFSLTHCEHRRGWHASDYLPQHLKSRPACQYQVNEQSELTGVGGGGVGVTANASLRQRMEEIINSLGNGRLMCCLALHSAAVLYSPFSRRQTNTRAQVLAMSRRGDARLWTWTGTWERQGTVDPVCTVGGLSIIHISTLFCGEFCFCSHGI